MSAQRKQPSEFAARRDALAARLEELQVDALIVSFLPNVRYLTGFTGSHAMLVVTPGHSTIFTDPRYDLQVRTEVDCRVRVRRGSLWKAVAPLVKRNKLERLGLESARVTLAARQELREAAPKGTRLKPVTAVVEMQRMVKSVTEVAAIRRSVDINSRAFVAALRRYRHPMSERDLAAEIDYQQRRAGAEGTAFETIVASGARSALPHARPTAATIVKNQLLLIDMGALHEGYASDMTRVVVPGTVTKKVKDLYQAVLEAQLAAIDSVRPGVKVARVDAAARKVLKQHRLEKLFTHSCGHGLGLEIHEPPRLARKEDTLLEAGMTITIEPGVYLKDFGGIRIEDTILVTPTGCEVLTPTPKLLAAI